MHSNSTEADHVERFRTIGPHKPVAATIGSVRHNLSPDRCVMSTAGQRSIDTAKSVMTVRVFKAGLFAALGHNHEITAPLASGEVDTAAGTVELHVDAAALKVCDPEASEKDRTEIQDAMLGPDVLDSEHHPQIVFRSNGPQARDGNSWTVRGNLTLHGQTHPLKIEVHETGGHYRGNARLRQTEFGMKPVKIAGGAIRVKDEIRVEFDIQLRF